MERLRIFRDPYNSFPNTHPWPWMGFSVYDPIDSLKSLGDKKLMQIIDRSCLILLVMALILGGCSLHRSVKRTTKLETIPTIDEMESALRSAPGLVSVERIDTSGQFTAYDKQDDHPPLVVAQWFYKSVDSAMALRILKHQDDTGEMELGMGWNDTPPRDEVEKARALMDTVYGHLQQNIAELPPASSLKEEFSGIKSH